MDAHNTHQIGFNLYRREVVSINKNDALDEQETGMTVQGRHVSPVENRLSFYNFKGPTTREQTENTYKVTMQENAELADLTQNAVGGGRKYGFKTRSLPHIRWLENTFSESWEAENTSLGAGRFSAGWERMMKVETK